MEKNKLYGGIAMGVGAILVIVGLAKIPAVVAGVIAVGLIVGFGGYKVYNQ